MLSECPVAQATGVRSRNRQRRPKSTRASVEATPCPVRPSLRPSPPGRPGLQGRVTPVLAKIVEQFLPDGQLRAFLGDEQPPSEIKRNRRTAQQSQDNETGAVHSPFTPEGAPARPDDLRVGRSDPFGQFTVGRDHDHLTIGLGDRGGRAVALFGRVHILHARLGETRSHWRRRSPASQESRTVQYRSVGRRPDLRPSLSL